MTTMAELLAMTAGALGFAPDVEDRDERDQWVKDEARRIFLKQGALIRTLIVRTGTTPRQIALMAQDLPYEMAHLGGDIGRALAKSLLAQQMYVVFEAWFSHAEGEELERLKRGEAPSVQPRHNPARKEALVVLSEDPFTNPPMRQWNAVITRNAKGKPSVGPWTAMPEGFTGRLTYLLPPEAYLAAGKPVPSA